MDNEMLESLSRLPRIQSLPELDEAGSSISIKELMAQERAWAEHNYQQLPDLVSRLLFVAVTGTDSEYIERFLLTYRRFATPRAVLLRIQLRFRELSHDTEPLDSVVDFARFRLCDLLQHWIKLYPTDFHAPGTTGALKALYRTISGLPDLKDYAIKLGPFIDYVCEQKHSLYDDPAWEWAVQETDPAILENEGDDGQIDNDDFIEELEMDIDSALGPDPDIELVSVPPTIPEDQITLTTSLSVLKRNRTNSYSSTMTGTTATPIASSFSQSPAASVYSFNASIHSQETYPRKLSSASPGLSSIPEPDSVPFPMSANSVPTQNPNNGLTRTSRASSSASTHSHILKGLNGLLPQLTHTSPLEVAQEITRIQLALFLKIEPRDWIRHVLYKSQIQTPTEGVYDPQIKGKQAQYKRPERIWEFVNFYNHLASWVTSLVLTHPLTNIKARVRTAARFILIARELRALHNYSGLRAVICGIMNATVEGDEMIMMLKEGEYKDLWKSLGSYIILMSSSKGHRHYRTAVSNVICGVIPESEIHTSDLQRTCSVQPDYHKGDPTRINWGKFAKMGMIIEEILACQKRCQRSVANRKFAFPERPQIRRWIEETEVMDADLLNSRMPPIEIIHENGPTSNTGTNSPPHGSLQRLASLFKG